MRGNGNFDGTAASLPRNERAREGRVVWRLNRKIAVSRGLLPRLGVLLSSVRTLGPAEVSVGWQSARTSCDMRLSLRHRGLRFRRHRARGPDAAPARQP